MPSANSLTALGIAPQAAQALGWNCVAVTAAGTVTGTATVLAPYVVANVTTAASQTGVRLPAANPGDEVVLNVTSSTTGNLYPPTGGTLNGSGSALSVAQNKTVHCFCYSPLVWFANLTA